MNTLLRFLYYILTRLTTLAIIAILIILALFVGFDWANINVIVNEGLTERADVILTNQEPTELNKFYTQEYLDRDSLLSRNPYENFVISGYDHRVKIKKLWVWPWQNKTRVVAEEVVTHIEGNNKNEDAEENIIPAWQSGEKIIVMEKDGRWRIENIILSKPIEPETSIDPDREGQEEQQVDELDKGEQEEQQDENQDE